MESWVPENSGFFYSYKDELVFPLEKYAYLKKIGGFTHSFLRGIVL